MGLAQVRFRNKGDNPAQGGFEKHSKFTVIDVAENEESGHKVKQRDLP